MIAITGGAGFIGSHIARKFNEIHSEEDLLLVDDLTAGQQKLRNIADLKIADYLDKEQFRTRVEKEDKNLKLKAVFHYGACTDRSEGDGRYVMDNNYHYSKTLLHYCLNKKIPFIYAISTQAEKKTNMVDYSQWLFDQYVRNRREPNSRIKSLRLSNVYGPYEQHKGPQASCIFHLCRQALHQQRIHLHGSAEAEHNKKKYQFLWVKDIAVTNVHLYTELSEKNMDYHETSRYIVNADTISLYELAVIIAQKAGISTDMQYLNTKSGNYTPVHSIIPTDSSPFTCETSVFNGIAMYIRWLNDNAESIE